MRCHVLEVDCDAGTVKVVDPFCPNHKILRLQRRTFSRLVVVPVKKKRVADAWLPFSLSTFTLLRNFRTVNLARQACGSILWIHLLVNSFRELLLYDLIKAQLNATIQILIDFFSSIEARTLILDLALLVD